MYTVLLKFQGTSLCLSSRQGCQHPETGWILVLNCHKNSKSSIHYLFTGTTNTVQKQGLVSLRQVSGKMTNDKSQITPADMNHWFMRQALNRVLWLIAQGLLFWSRFLKVLCSSKPVFWNSTVKYLISTVFLLCLNFNIIKAVSISHVAHM